MKTALFFGSFNPIHTGHLAIAQFVLNHTVIEHIEFVLSPQNPHKNIPDLLSGELRKKIILSAIQDNPQFSLNDIEFQLPLPSFTTQTLTALKSKFPNNSPRILMGSDTFSNIGKWKDPEHILSYPIIIYKREQQFKLDAADEKIQLLNSPILEISATEIRYLIQNNQSVQYITHHSTNEYLESIREELNSNQD